MSDIIVNRHNFEEAKNKLEVFSRNLPTPPELKTVKESYWGMIGRDVSGKEFNVLVKDVQRSLEECNRSVVKLFREFNEVYKTFDTLDRDYIESICGAIKEANVAIEENKKTLTSVAEAQEAINQSYEAYEKMFHKLKDIKGELKGDIATLESSIASLSANITSINSFVAQTDSKLDAQVANYNTAMQDIGKRLSELEALQGLEGKVSVIEAKLTALEAAKQSNTLPIVCAVVSIVAVAADIALQVFGIL